MLDYFSILHQHLAPDHPFYRVYLVHATLVTNKALAIARRLELSVAQQEFIEEAGMLHDIGVTQVNSGKYQGAKDLPYICHGTEGAALLRVEGLEAHARVAERHTGVGITRHEIEERNLPLPHQDFVPETIEEEIISYADLFFSKRLDTPSLWKEDSPAEVRQELLAFGEAQAQKFDEWHQKFA